MITSTENEKVVDLLNKYMFEEPTQDTLMRLKMDMITIIGPNRNLAVLFDNESNELKVSVSDEDNTTQTTFTVNAGIYITTESLGEKVEGYYCRH